MDNSNRQMFPFDDALHVHQAGTVRPDNVFGSGSHMVFHLVTSHADGYRLFFYRKHSPEAAALVNMARFKDFDTLHKI